MKKEHALMWDVKVYKAARCKCHLSLYRWRIWANYVDSLFVVIPLLGFRFRHYSDSVSHSFLAYNMKSNTEPNPDGHCKD